MLGLAGAQLEINSLGHADDRRAHRAALIAYFEAHAGQLDEDARRRLHSNPLRILDSKNPAMQALVEAAPKLIDDLGAESRAHFERRSSGPGRRRHPFRINPRLVRGLDYYNLTVFEWVTDKRVRRARSAPAVATIRWSSAARRQAGAGLRIRAGRRAGAGDAARMAGAADRLRRISWCNSWRRPRRRRCRRPKRLRDAGLDVVMHCGGGSFKSQMKKADASLANYAVLIGDDEAAENQVTLKHCAANMANNPNNSAWR
jgi:histidyl-tRNA synthetase